MRIDLQNALESLYGLERRRDKLGLDGTRELLAALGQPQRRFRAVHVAGTNGKGSVCALIERVLRAAGVRTGLFTSPHLVDFRERIRVNGVWADEHRLADRLAALGDSPAGRDRTFFEVATALAFDAFAAAEVEWAVVEVGLGGRLDTTNVLRPALSVITSIAMDHGEVLGETPAAVAGEKAGIIKCGTPVVAAMSGGPAAGVIRSVSRVRGAPLRIAADWVRMRDVRTGPDGSRFRAELAPWGELRLELGLRGRHQLENAAVALTALATLASTALPLPASAVERGFALARWPGRLEPCPNEPRLWWDGAHNPDGMVRLVAAWARDLGVPPPEAIVFATGQDKDPAAMLETLRRLAPRAQLIVTRARNPRAQDPQRLAAEAMRLGWRAATEAGVGDAVRRALEHAGAGRVLLAGSLFAIGEAMEEFGGAPGARL